MMKKLGLAILLVIFCITKVQALCFFEDVGCIAPLVLPDYDSDPNSIREWSASSGFMFAFDNVIVAKVRFDDQSLSVLKSNPNFGLEIEAVIKGENRGRVLLDDITSTFPSSAKPGRDTEVCDFVTNDDTTVYALHILNPFALEKDTDYFIFFWLKDYLPEDKIEIKPDIQIAIDMNYLAWWADWAIELVPEFDQFEYYVLETDSYVTFQPQFGPFQGTCWDSKGSSYNCNIFPDTSSPSENNLQTSTGQGYSNIPNGGNSVITQITDPPISHQPYPNLRIWSVGVFTTDGHEKNEQESYLTVGQTYEVRVYPIAEEEDCVNGVDADTENVETDIYYKISQEDSDGEWKFWKRVYTRPSTLVKGDPHKETALFTVPEEAKNLRVYFKAKVDSTKEVHETSEDDNESHWPSEWYPVAGNYDFTISFVGLDAGQPYLNEGEHYGYDLTIQNNGSDTPLTSIESAYYHQYPNSDTWELVATDGTDGSELASGQEHGETIHYQPFIADVPGIHKVKACANYKNAVPELDFTNNCTIASYSVNMYRPDFVISQTGLTGGRTALNLGDHFGLRMRVTNQGTAPATVGIQSAYYLKPPNASDWQYMTGDGTDANELCAGCFKEEWTTEEPFIANIVGTWQEMVCTNTQAAKEVDATNDCLTFTFPVNPVGPDFIVSDLYLKVGSTIYREGSTIRKDSIVHPYVVLTNVGTGSTHPAFRVAYYIDSGKFRDSDGIDANQLPVGSFRTEYVSNNDIRLGSTGTRTYRACVDYLSTAPELDETNNCKTITFYVR